LQNIQKAHELARRIEGECNIPLLHKRDFFNEFSIRLPMPASDVIKAMEESRIFAGVSQERFFLKRMNDVLTIAVTEKRTKAELELYVKTLKRVTARREAQ
jgi:glycine dehydrogenase subunit 1